jgi:hypothetical protein
MSSQKDNSSGNYQVLASTLAWPSGWTLNNIGKPPAEGSATYNGNTSGGLSWIIGSKGMDIVNRPDQFAYVNGRFQGANSQFAIVGKIESLTYTNIYAQSGFMWRENNMDPFCKFIAIVVGPDNSIAVHCRPVYGASHSSKLYKALRLPVYLRLQRNGDTYTVDTSYTSFFVSRAHMPITDKFTCPMTNPYVGMCVSSHNSGAMCVAEFKDVHFESPIGPLQQ